MSVNITIYQAAGGSVSVNSTTVVLESPIATTPAPPVATPTPTESPIILAPDVAGIRRVVGFIQRAADALRARIHRATAA
ncbi:hypothetical protein B0H14DRAFT_3460256 [Mycena olivaceomarginata]|nr:hypothetical protein B0H14DRAFT_3460256 [Mycena olivaceomarginata]